MTAITEQHQAISYAPIPESIHGIPLQFEDQPQKLTPNWRINLVMAGLMVGQALAERGIFDDSPRIYGADESGHPVILPHYKPRTMPRMSPDEKAELDRMRRDGTFIKGIHDARTPIGKILTKLNLDEIPFYPIIGAHKWFGVVRPLMTSEIENDEFAQAAWQHGMEPSDVLRAMSGNIGYFCVMHSLGVRVLDKHSWGNFMKAVHMPKSEHPSKLHRFMSVFSKRIRSQSSSSQIAEE